MATALLKGLRILVTRPDPGGSALCEAINLQGGVALHLPTIAFTSPPDQALFEQTVSELGQQDWLIFVSPQAVYASVPSIRRHWPVFPSKVKFAAIGAGTAKALQAAGYQACHPASDWHSEGLLAMPEFQQVDGKAIAIIRGVGGREKLAQTLIERGASILPVIAYQRIVPPLDVSAYQQAIADGLVDAIVCTSYDSVQHLKTLLGSTSWNHLKRIPLIVVSERIKTLAGDLGFQTIWIASQPSSEAILSTLSQLV